jgi:hypothetical protein
VPIGEAGCGHRPDVAGVLARGRCGEVGVADDTGQAVPARRAVATARFPGLALAPNSVAAASGMLMGLATGVAGVLYIPIGKLQELIGVTGALTVAYLSLVRPRCWRCSSSPAICATEHRARSWQIDLARLIRDPATENDQRSRTR